MRIISKFKDYYDIGLSYGIDPHLHYVRNDKSFHDKLRSVFKDVPSYKDRIRDFGSIFPYNSGYNKLRRYSRSLIGFCGKFYPVIKIDSIVQKSLIFWDYEPTYVYDVDSFLDLLKKDKDFKDADISQEGMKDIEDCAKTIFTSFEGFEDDTLFLKYNAPIIHLHTNDIFSFNVWSDDLLDEAEVNVKINPQLKEFEFFKIKDPYTAFQDLSMYMGNIFANTQPDMAKVTEPEIIEKKGFDPTYGFRKRPDKE